MSLNRAMVISYLGGDPELRYLPSGQPVVSFSVATEESYTDKQDQKKERVEWHRRFREACGNLQGIPPERAAGVCRRAASYPGV
jgi:single-strand DNA-binding protein